MADAPAPITGVLLAAGRGRRMGGSKQLLPWPPGAPTTTLVAAACDAIAPVCAAMIVVLGHDGKRVEAALAGRSFSVARSDPDAPMFASIRAGLEAAGDGPVLLHPADHPCVAPATLAALIAAGGGEQAVLPVHGGRGGHPVLIPAALVRRLRGLDPPDGLAGWWRRHPALVRRIPVVDPSVVRDVDRPDDLAGA